MSEENSTENLLVANLPARDRSDLSLEGGLASDPIEGDLSAREMSEEMKIAREASRKMSVEEAIRQIRRNGH